MTENAALETDTTHYLPGRLQGAHIDAERYQQMYSASVSDPDAFWAELGNRVEGF